MFLLWAFCMMLTASTELAPQGMQSLVLEKTAGMNGTYILIYTSLMMFVLQALRRPDRASPLARGDVDRVGAALGHRIVRAQLRLRLHDRDRRGDDLRAGHRLLLADDARCDRRTVPARRGLLAGTDGVRRELGDRLVQPWMGRINDQITFAAIPAELQNQIVVAGGHRRRTRSRALPPEQQTIVTEAQKEGAKWSFRYVSVLPLILIFIFGGIALSDRARGGYKPEDSSARNCRPRSLPRTISC